MSTPAPPADPNAGGQPPAPSAPPAVPAPPPPAIPPAPAPQNPPVPQPPTWTPPPPPAVDDGGIDDISKLPKKWQKEITDLRSENAGNRVKARSETVLRHAYTTATAHGVNPDALLGSTVFAASAAALDPSSAEFPAKLAEAIKGALTANPWMAAQQAPAVPPAPPVPSVSGGDFTGAGGAPQTQSIDQQIAQAEKDRNFALAIALKRQRAALTNPPTT